MPAQFRNSTESVVQSSWILGITSISLDIELTMPVKSVDSWETAVEACSRTEWENIELEAQNQLSLWLHDNARERFQKWNEIVVDHKDTTVNTLIENKIRHSKKN
jgi:hypothetical protein